VFAQQFNGRNGTNECVSRPIPFHTQTCIYLYKIIYVRGRMQSELVCYAMSWVSRTPFFPPSIFYVNGWLFLYFPCYQHVSITSHHITSHSILPLFIIPINVNDIVNVVKIATIHHPNCIASIIYTPDSH